MTYVSIDYYQLANIIEIIYIMSIISWFPKFFEDLSILIEIGLRYVEHVRYRSSETGRYKQVV